MTGQTVIAGTRTLGPTGRPLTRLQQLTFDYVAAHEGVSIDEVGALLHAHRPRRPHSMDERCVWCARHGRSMLESVALRPLLRRGPGTGRYLVRVPV